MINCAKFSRAPSLTDKFCHFATDTACIGCSLHNAAQHTLQQIDNLGVAEVIVVREDGLEGGVDRRQADGGAVGF